MSPQPLLSFLCSSFLSCLFFMSSLNWDHPLPSATSSFLAFTSRVNCSVHALSIELQLSHQSLGKWDLELGFSPCQAEFSHFPLGLAEPSAAGVGSGEYIILPCQSQRQDSFPPAIKVWPNLRR